MIRSTAAAGAARVPRIPWIPVWTAAIPIRITGIVCAVALPAACMTSVAATVISRSHAYHRIAVVCAAWTAISVIWIAIHLLSPLFQFCGSPYTMSLRIFCASIFSPHKKQPRFALLYSRVSATACFRHLIRPSDPRKQKHFLFVVIPSSLPARG